MSSGITRGVVGLPHALGQRDLLFRRLDGRTPAVFLDYDGVLAPIVDRPEDAVISPSMRTVVQDLASRVKVCVVSGRDRRVVQDLMGLDELVVAGSHGFDIWSPSQGEIQHPGGSGFEELMSNVASRVQTQVASIEGASVEPKKASVALHYRLAADRDLDRIQKVVDAVLKSYPGQLKVTPGKKVFEIQPNIDWDKGKAVLHLIEVLGLDGEDVVPLYLGDDITDEDAFEALSGRGLGIWVGDVTDPDVADRTTFAEFSLQSPQEVEMFLGGLAQAAAHHER